MQGTVRTEFTIPMDTLRKISPGASESGEEAEETEEEEEEEGGGGEDDAGGAEEPRDMFKS